MMWVEKMMLGISLYEGGGRALAKKVGCVYTTIYRFMRGVKSMNILIAERICKEIGLDLVDVSAAKTAKPAKQKKKTKASKKKPVAKKQKNGIFRLTSPIN